MSKAFYMYNWMGKKVYFYSLEIKFLLEKELSLLRKIKISDFDN